MSYDIRLVDKDTKKTLTTRQAVPQGGTYCVGGDDAERDLWLNVTYNYGVHYRRVLDAEKGIHAIYGKSGREAIPMLNEAILKLNADVDPDYWTPTEGNARKALIDLVNMAYIAPDGIFEGD